MENIHAKRLTFGIENETITVEVRESGPLCFEIICPKCSKPFTNFPTERAVYYNGAEIMRGVRECPDHLYRNH